MSIKERRERERNGMKTVILEAARSIMVQDGWQAVTIRKIADRIEYSSPTIYEHFKNKEAIQYELMRDGFRQLLADLAAVVSEADAPCAHLRALSRTYWQFAFAHTETYQIMHGLDGIPFGTAETPQEARDAFSLLRDALKSAFQSANVTAPDLDSEVEVWWGTLHGLIALATSKRIKDHEQRIEPLLEHAVYNLLLAWGLTGHNESVA